MTTQTEIVLTVKEVENLIAWFQFFSGYCYSARDPDLPSAVSDIAAQLKGLLPK